MLNKPNAEESRALRRKDREDQILDAASECFVEHGFHGTAMALIATRSQMSVGQIYRFFASKEAIIAAIIARQLDLLVSRFPKPAAMGINGNDMPSRAMTLTGADLFEPQRAGLIIEIRAEATRNPKVAEIVRAADVVLEEHVRNLVISRSASAHDSAEMERRVKFLAVVIDGLIFRSFIDRQMHVKFADELIDLVCGVDLSS